MPRARPATSEKAARPPSSTASPGGVGGPPPATTGPRCGTPGPSCVRSALRRHERRRLGGAAHRDDLELRLGGHALRDFGSTGQQRCAAIALKLLELETIERATGRCPALLLDDVFAELDPDRQARLSQRLFRGRPAQVFVSAPREDELPPGLELPVWNVAGGVVSDER